MESSDSVNYEVYWLQEWHTFSSYYAITKSQENAKWSRELKFQKFWFVDVGCIYVFLFDSTYGYAHLFEFKPDVNVCRFCVCQKQVTKNLMMRAQVFWCKKSQRIYVTGENS